MADDLSTTEQYMLAQVLVCGAVRAETLYNSSPMLTTSQEKALESLEEKGLLDQTLFDYNGS